MNYALLLEDHTETRAWLKQMLLETFSGIIVHEAATIKAAKQVLATKTIDLALLDINLPDGSGIDLAQSIHDSDNTLNAKIYIVMTTIFDDDKHIFSALKAGAKGYLLKEQPKAQIIQRLTGILVGEPPLSPSIARKILAHFQGSAQPKIESSLTNREEEVLTLAAKGYKTKEIANLLKISTNTCAGYLKNTYRKLSISSRAEATLEATRLGLVSSN